MSLRGTRERQTDNNLVRNFHSLPDVIRLVDQDQNTTIISRSEVRSRVNDSGLDLYLVSADAKPPVYRLLDYGRYKFEQQKKQRELQRKARDQNKPTKEYKFKPMIGEHDLIVKIEQMTIQLEDGYDVRAFMDLKKNAFVLTNRRSRRLDEVLQDPRFVLNRIAAHFVDHVQSTRLMISENQASILLKRKP